MLDKKYNKTKQVRWIGIFFIVFVAILIGLNYIFYADKTNSRTNVYHSANEIVRRIKVEDIRPLIETQYEFYKGKLSALYTNMTVTLILCIVSIILIRRKGDIEIPAVNIKLPIRICYLIVPACLCFYWLQFGFILYDSIMSRIELVRLIQAEYMLTNNVSDISKISFADYITLTRIVSLKDTGFLDTWFMFYYPDLFPLSEAASKSRAVPWLLMVMFGSLYGISHGFSLGLPINWIIRYKIKDIWYKRLALMLFILTAILISASHYSFYFVLRNVNAVQMIILIVAVIVIMIVTRDSVRDSYKHEELEIN